MTMIEFWVTGEPAPQGSKRHVGAGRMIESSAKVRPWRDTVCDAALTAAATTEGTRWLGVPDKPVELIAYFYLRRPPSAPKRRFHPDRKPDLDKLLRSTLDALKDSGLIADDARVVRATTQKIYAEAGQATGAVVRMREMTE